MLGMYSLSIPIGSSTVTASVSNILSHSSSAYTQLSPEYFSTVLEGIECLIFLYLLRGQSSAAMDPVRVFSQLVQSRYSALKLSPTPTAEERANKAQLLSLVIRSHSLTSVALAACSKNEKERLKAISECNLATNKADEHGGVNLLPDVTQLICLGLQALAQAHLHDASEYFSMAAEYSLESRHKVKQCCALVGEAWCSFLSGRRGHAQRVLEFVLNFASTTSNMPLHIWALELDILMKTFTRDYSGADEAKRIITSMQRDMKYGATSAAVVAYYMAASNQHKRATSYATYACSLLAAKRQGSAFGCVFLFLAAYALLDIIESKVESVRGSVVAAAAALTNSSPSPAGDAFPNLNIQTSHQSSFMIRQVSRQNSFASLGNAVMGSPRQDPNPIPSLALFKKPKTEMETLMDTVTQAIEALNQHAQRYPGLYPLVWCVTGRLRRLEGCDYLVLVEMMMELDCAIQASHQILKSFVFADAFVHLQRAILCKTLNLSFNYEFMPSNDQHNSSGGGAGGGGGGNTIDSTSMCEDSRVIARFCFARLGGHPDVLEALGTPPSRHVAPNGDGGSAHHWYEDFLPDEYDDSSYLDGDDDEEEDDESGSYCSESESSLSDDGGNEGGGSVTSSGTQGSRRHLAQR